jgi:small glutamine-rich tetratricopeptide repeat-containing protein alpha
MPARADSDTDDDDAAAVSRGAPSSSAPGAGGMPDLASMASMFGGMGGGGGGMPDLATMMKNPQLMQMAQSMMANGGLEKLMAVRAPTVCFE